MRFCHCPSCGERLSSRDLGDEHNVPWCDKCGGPWFEMFYCCVIVLARRGEKFALIKQKSPEQSERDKYVCVSGYIKTSESAEDAARREVYEELGLAAKSVRFISSYVYEKKQMLMLGYCVDVDEGEFKLSDELYAAQWFDKERAASLLKDTSVGNRLIADILKEGE